MPNPPKYTWAKYVLATLIAGALITGLWIAQAIRNVQRIRESTAGQNWYVPGATIQPGAVRSGSPDWTNGMVWIPDGSFLMGSETGQADEKPVHKVTVKGFWMDKTEVTNDEFEKFVKATGYVTVAEQKPTKEEFPTAPPENLVAGSAVFTATPRPVPLSDYIQWWSYVPGANWRHPTGQD